MRSSKPDSSWRVGRSIVLSLCGEPIVLQPQFVAQPAQVGPGRAGAAGALGAVLDPPQEGLELASRTAGGCLAWGPASERRERLIEPAPEVVVEELPLELARLLCREPGRRLTPRRRARATRAAGLEGRDFSLAQLGERPEALLDELDRRVEPTLRRGRA